MLKRVMALFMAVLLLSGFSWGRSEEEGQPAKAQTKSQAAYGGTAAPRKSDYSSMPVKTQQSQVTAQAGAAQGQFPTQLLSSLASGDEEVRRARIESLRRLSEAMSKMNARQQPAAE